MKYRASVTFDAPSDHAACRILNTCDAGELLKPLAGGELRIVNLSRRGNTRKALLLAGIVVFYALLGAAIVRLCGI